jgi:hypothetical protein
MKLTSADTKSLINKFGVEIVSLASEGFLRPKDVRKMVNNLGDKPIDD